MTIRPIPPLKLDDGQEYYVAWCSPFQSDVLELMKRLEGLNWRRVKRELRKLNERGHIRGALK